ncbi:MAG: ATP-binding cassette domain-containing protein [Tannerellaceae bacterium]|jgi:ABC-type multidrug transport system ATPase subunit|nr:ATP-binding cassette domain-containing protein [Tannerellaceae bacterium]
MNEIILNGLLNLFAIFASIVKIEKKEAEEAVRSYLYSHFGVRSHKEYIELYNELRSLYDDSLYAINKEHVVNNICKQMKAKLTHEEQLLQLVRFLEFAYNNSGEFESHLGMFRNISEIFQVSDDIFTDAIAFVSGKNSPSILTISGDETHESTCFIRREGMEGCILVWYISRFDRYLFAYRGSGIVYMNDLPVSPGIFYSWQHSSVVKGPRFLPIYFSNVQAVFNQDRRNESVRLSGRDIEFSFPGAGAPGIHNFSFDLESGQLVAIMGGSGVGKSTLLSLLNGSLSPAGGSITVNGQSIASVEAQRLIGFVPQDDLLVEELTVYKNLWYTARFCFDGLSRKEIAGIVDRTLAELELSDIAHLQVGSPISKTISGGQRKRLNIALELIREPSILFLDEPTSGLSSTDSEKLMMLLKEQTHKGRLIIVNIHQPSSEIYKMFDRLWLLDKGGYPIYDGNPIEAVTWFKQAARYTDQNISVCEACGNVNPELILNIIDSKVIDDSGKQTNIRMYSPAEWHEKYVAARPAFDEIHSEPLPTNRQKRPSPLKQFLIFASRNIQTKLTNTQFILIALLEAPLLALIVAWLTKFGEDGAYTLYGNKHFLSYIFMSVIVVTFIGMSISAEEIIRDRTILKRERFLRLSRRSYLASKMACLLALSGLQTLMFVCVGNGIIEVGSDMFLRWWAALWITTFLANLTGLWLSQTLNSVVSIYISIPLLLIPQILLCGLVIPFEDLKTGKQSNNLVPLIAEIIPSRWAFEALTVEQFSGNAYNRIFFAPDKEKFLAQYYKDVHIPQLRSLITANDPSSASAKIVEAELPLIARAARIDPPSKATSRTIFLDKADSALRIRSHNYVSFLNKIRSQIVDSISPLQFAHLMHTSHNEALEALLTGRDDRLFRQTNSRLYPCIAPVYFEPENQYGRAPFYSHAKRLGSRTYDTFGFNLAVLSFFAILAIIIIFAELPERYLRQQNNH